MNNYIIKYFVISLNKIEKLDAYVTRIRVYIFNLLFNLE